jgi:hypothetical protein
MNEKMRQIVKSLDLSRGDTISNESGSDAKIGIEGLGVVLIPSGESVTLARKGVDIYGDWEADIYLAGGHVQLVLRTALETKEADAQKPLEE